MKKIAAYMALIAGAVCLFLLVPRAAHADWWDEEVAINSTNFPDKVFRQYVKDNYDSDKNGALSLGERYKSDPMWVNDMGIKSLKGIEHLLGLWFLNCSDNQLTSLDISQNANLKNLWCDNNQLKTLDVSNNTSLKQLSCTENQLKSLNVSKNTSLDFLQCGDNPLTSLDVSKNTALEYLHCSFTSLTTLNITKNTALKNLRCQFVQLTALNVTKNTELEEIYCDFTKLTALDISKNPKLKELDCSGTSIDTLDISAAPALVDLYKNGEREESVTMVKIGDRFGEEGYLAYNKSTKIVINPFTDVLTSDSFYSAVMWAVNIGVTSGTSATTFSPNASCTRYQFAVMLYKLNGKPSVGNVTLPFTDVNKSDSYYNAVAWAYTNGIISGTSKTTFSPKDEVTRYQVVAMLYKSVGKPAISTTVNPFTDVPQNASYFKAVLWAVEKGITKGTSATAFSPNATCKRYQMVVFLNKFNKIYQLK